MLEHIGYIYVITNRVNGKQYVGKTQRSVAGRMQGHLNEAKAGSSRAICRAIRKHGRENFDLSVLEEIDASVDDLNAAEIRWIKQLGTYGTGYNQTRGGEGQVGYVPSLEHLAKISRPVVAYDAKTGQKLYEFPSCREAERVLGQMAIGSMCHGVTATSRGMIWKYAGEQLTDADMRRVRLRYTRIHKGVVQYSLDCYEIATYDCAKDAELATSVQTSNIHAGCKFKTRAFG